MPGPNDQISQPPASRVYYTWGFTDFVVSATRAGIVTPLTHFADEKDAISWKWDAPLNKPIIGLGGNTAVAPTSNNSGYLYLKFLWQSPANTYLMNLVKTQQVYYANGLPNPLSISIINKAGTDFSITCNYCVITKRPDGELGKGFTTREYEFYFGEMIESPGSSPYGVDNSASLYNNLLVQNKPLSSSAQLSDGSTRGGIANRESRQDYTLL